MSKCVRNGVSYKRHAWVQGTCEHCGDSQSKVYFDSPSQLASEPQAPLTPAYPEQNQIITDTAKAIAENESHSYARTLMETLDNHNKDT
jgi:hypothetical protein